VVAVRVGRALRGDAEPLLVHVEAALDVVLGVPAVGPARVRVVDVEVLVLLVLPPAVVPLEHEAAHRVSDVAAAHVPVYVLPLGQEVAGLRQPVLTVPLRVEGVGAELGVEHRDSELLLHHRIEVARRLAAVHVRAEHVEVGHLGRDEVDVLHVAVADRDGHPGVELVDGVHHLPEERVEVLRPQDVALALGQRLDLEGGPGKPVVVLVPEQPQQDAGRAGVAPHRGERRLADRGPVRRVRVVDVADPAPVDGDAVAAEQRVHHRPDAVVLVDPGHPLRRDVVVLADDVHAHRTEQ
ncbi:MAG: hypothetical protein ACK559_25055, partial [bacterium]